MTLKITNLADEFQLAQHPSQVEYTKTMKKEGSDQRAHGKQQEIFEDDLVVPSDKAYRVIIMLQERMTKQRSYWEMRYQTMKKRLEDKVAFTEQQLSSNKDLWESMKAQEER